MGPMRAAATREEAARAARISVISNIFLTCTKLATGFLTGSVSVLSEAVHSGLDLVAAAMAFVAVRKAREPADEEHAFGHGKFESMSGLAEGLLILVAVGLIAWGAGRKLITGDIEVNLPLAGAGIMVVSAVVNVFVSRLLFRVARETNSVALEADAWHLRTDVWTSLGVFGGMAAIDVGARLGFSELHHLDPVVALVVAGFIARASGGIIWRSWNHLVDRSLSPADIAKIEHLLEDHYPQLIGFHRLRTREAGHERYIDIHIEVPGDMSVNEAHELCDHLEAELRELMPG
ncbi:MAG: cation transporter, partial [Armatimonadetes bacterium]|nr:cation transporter [Armatimonadota bacterium]